MLCLLPKTKAVNQLKKKSAEIKVASAARGHLFVCFIMFSIGCLLMSLEFLVLADHVLFIILLPVSVLLAERMLNLPGKMCLPFVEPSSDIVTIFLKSNSLLISLLLRFCLLWMSVFPTCELVYSVLLIVWRIVLALGLY